MTEMEHMNVTKILNMQSVIRCSRNNEIEETLNKIVLEHMIFVVIDTYLIKPTMPACDK